MGELQRVALQRPAFVSASRATETAQRARVDRRDTDAAPLRRMMAAGALQPRLAVGAADDPFEHEAERTADVVTAPESAPKAGGDGIARTGVAASLMRVVRRALGKTDPPTKKDDDEKKKLVQKDSAGTGPSVVPAGIESSIESMSAGGGGSPLSPSLRSQFEPRFGYDFGGVRAHTGGEAAGAATALGARAFTVGDHIFFGAGEYQPGSAQGQHLIAHELTHTIQQKPAAARASRLIAPRAVAPRRVQRLFEDTKAAIRNKVREFIVRDFPPWDLITLIIGYDPIQEKSVKGATRDWIHAAMKLAPDGEALFDRLDKEGKIDSVAKWWDAQVAKLDLTYASMVALVNKAWEAVSAGDILDPAGAWNKKLKPIFEPVVKRVWDFIKEVGGKILAVVKDLVLNQLGEWAKKQKGYPLLTMILGKDPVTGEEVKPTLKGVIYAVLDLIDGGDKIKENLEKAKTIEKAAAWFKDEVKKLDLTWDGIKALFKQAWDAFKIADLLTPKILFEKMAAIFGPPVLRLLKFLLAVAKKILEFIFEGAMLIAGPIGVQIVGIVKKIGDTFNKIVDDPVAFVGHLVDAVKKGITQFAKNILDHLKTGLIEWLVGTLDGAGIVLPKVWDLKGILDLVLQILGITYAKIRVKLVKVLGEKTVSMLEKAFAFIKTLVTEGPAAAWKQIVDAIGGLWDMVIGGIKDWAITKIVTAAIMKLVTMFNPAGAIIQAIIATYNTVAFFIERIKQILAFVEAVVDSIANIANGKIDAAANWVEKAMARTIPVILGFLARLIGLGNVSDAVKKVITAIQAKVDKGIDFVIDWVVKQARALFGGKSDDKDDKKDGKELGDGEAKQDFTLAGESHTITAIGHGKDVQVTMASGAAKRLWTTVNNAMEELDKSPPRPKPERDAIYKILGKVRLDANEPDIWREWDTGGRKGDFQSFLVIRVSKLIGDLAPLSQLGIKSLDDLFKKVPPNRKLPVDYQGDWVRTALYHSDGEWKAKSTAIVSRDKPKIKKRVDAANKNRDFTEWHALIGPSAIGKYIPETAELGKFTGADVDAVPMSVDHIIGVAEHWQGIGHNTKDGPRRTVGIDDDTNFELVTVRYNSSKTTGKFIAFVDGDFESNLAKSEKLDRKIAGRFFLKPDGSELT